MIKDLKNNNLNSILDDPYIIAEVGVNHENSIDTALDLINLAKEGGANAVKFQTYKAETLASKNSPAYWDTSKEKTLNQKELFKKYDSFNEEEYVKLSEFCKKVDIDFLSTPFDTTAVTFLNPLLKYFKVASADITNYELLKKIAYTRKPVILSTGASYLNEINSAINFLYENGSKDIILMHCILNYPTSDQNANLNMISSLKKEFPNNLVGYSDHTLPSMDMINIVAAYTLGASVIEKHFTHDKSLPGNDHYHAMDVNDLKMLKKKLKTVKEIMGSLSEKTAIPSETIARHNARRSIVAKKNLKKGDVISKDNIICKRPATGIYASEYFNIIGMKMVKDAEEDTILEWSMLGKS